MTIQEIEQSVVKFNQARMIPRSFNKSKEVANILDEVLEALRAQSSYDLVDAFNDASVFAFGALWKKGAKYKETLTEAHEQGTNFIIEQLIYMLKNDNTEDEVHSLCLIIDYCRKSVKSCGYHYEIAMEECLNEIHDRTGYYDMKTGKWLKMPPKPNAYKADYSKAKINGI